MADEKSNNISVEPPLPKGWVKCISKKFERPYYYHEITKCSIWVHPSLLNPQEEADGSKECFAARDRSIKLRPKCRSSEQIKTNMCLSPTGKHLIATSNTDTSKTKLIQHGLKRIYDAYESEEIEEEHDQIPNYRDKNDSSYFDSKSNKLTQTKTVQPIKPMLKPLLPIPKSALSILNRKRVLSEGIIDKPGEHININKKSKVAKLKLVTDIYTPAMKAVTDRRKLKVIPTPAMKTVIERRKLNVIPTTAKKDVTDKRKVNISKANSNKTYSWSEVISETACHKKKKKKKKSGNSKQEQCNCDEECGVINEVLRNSNTVMTGLKPLKPRRNKLEVHVETESSLISVNTINLKGHMRMEGKLKSNINASNIGKAYLNIHQKQNINTQTTCSKNSINTSNSPHGNVYGSNFIHHRGEKEKLTSTTANTGGIQQNNFMNREMKGVSDQKICLQPDILETDNVDEEEDMEVDDAVEFGNEIMKEIQELREENIIEKPEVAKMEQQSNLPVYSDLLYIVLDTNILLGHLKFVSELKDYPIPGVGTPILVVPWMVFQELDSLKSAANRYHVQINKDGIQEKSQKLSYLARQAINFIGSCLDGDHPRLKGESAIEAGTPITGFTEESNDDSIIHCGLGLKIRAVYSHIVILSNDRNLCNKAIVVGIKAFQQQNIILGLVSLFKNGTFVAEKEYEVDVNAKRRKQADELSCELQCILRDGWSKIIEEEMTSAYGKKLWLSIVKIKPPWTLQDIFILLEKHWIAVFGNIVNRKLIKHIIELKDKFNSGRSSPVNFEMIKNMLQQSFEILSDFAIHSDYNGMLTKCIAGICSLIKNTHDEKQAILSHTLSRPPVETSNSHTKCVSDSDKLSDLNSEKQQTTHMKVRKTFDDIWNAVNHFSALIFYSLNFPSPLIKDLEANQEKPPAQESLSCLSIMAPYLLNIIKRIQNVIFIPIEDLSNNQQILINLLESIYMFMKEMMKQNCTINPEELLKFCQDSNTRNALVQGLSQLDRLYAMLQQCVEYHQSSD